MASLGLNIIGNSLTQSNISFSGITGLTSGTTIGSSLTSSDGYATFIPDIDETSEKKPQTYNEILEDAFAKKNDYALDNPAREEALKKLDDYIEKYADIQYEHKLPAPIQSFISTDKEKELNTEFDKLLKSRGYDGDIITLPDTDTDTCEVVKMLPDDGTDKIMAEINSKFDYITYMSLHKNYTIYMTSTLKTYHETYDKLINAINEFNELKKWIKSTPSSASLTNEILFMAIDSTITKLEIPTLIDSLSHLSKVINYLNTTNPQYKPKHICTICVTDEINTVIKECGHTFCGTCLKAQTKCPKCRHTPITSTKMYIE